MNSKINRMLHAILKDIGADQEMKQEMIYNFTGGRTIHSSELSDKEGIALINNIRQGKEEEMRKQLIAMSYSIGHDVDFIKNWSETYGIFGIKKKFNHYNMQELVGLKKKFQDTVIKHRKQVTAR